MIRETPLADLIPLWRTLREDGVTVLVTPALDYVGAVELGTLDVRFSASEQAFNIGEGLRSLVGSLGQEGIDVERVKALAGWMGAMGDKESHEGNPYTAAVDALAKAAGLTVQELRTLATHGPAPWISPDPLPRAYLGGSARAGDPFVFAVVDSRDGKERWDVPFHQFLAALERGDTHVSTASRVDLTPVRAPEEARNDVGAENRDAETLHSQHRNTGARLQAATCDVVGAARLLRRFFGTRKVIPDALLAFDGSQLAFEVAGVRRTVSATGRWPGEVRIPASFLLRLGNLEPSPDLLELSVTDAQLTIRLGSWSYTVPCTTETIPRTGPLPPLNATLIDTLAFAFSHDTHEIEQAGLKKVVDAALQKAEQKIAAAEESLRELGITADELREFVRSAVRQRRS